MRRLRRHRSRKTISIHALRKESDRADVLDRSVRTISIHALRKESDVQPTLITGLRYEISIHALRKESDHAAVFAIAENAFQSTLSVRRATHSKRGPVVHHHISIHALRKESDPHTRSRVHVIYDFNPRSP